LIPRATIQSAMCGACIRPSRSVTRPGFTVCRVNSPALAIGGEPAEAGDGRIGAVLSGKEARRVGLPAFQHRVASGQPVPSKTDPVIVTASPFAPSRIGLRPRSSG
jgi:hypothetical protein